MIQAMTRSFVPMSGAGNVLVRPDHADDFRGVAAREPLEFVPGEAGGIDPHASLRAAEGELHQARISRSSTWPAPRPRPGSTSWW